MLAPISCITPHRPARVRDFMRRNGLTTKRTRTAHKPLAVEGTAVLPRPGSDNSLPTAGRGPTARAAGHKYTGPNVTPDHFTRAGVAPIPRGSIGSLGSSGATNPGNLDGTRSPSDSGTDSQKPFQCIVRKWSLGYFNARRDPLDFRQSQIGQGDGLPGAEKQFGI
ncbi:hypothetical protein EMMF5_003175 [Cystobasidiomycetes sp. EMM_F5]